MNLEFVGRNFEIDDRVRRFAEGKLGKKLLRLVQEPVEIRVTLETEKHRNIADLHVSHRGGVLQAAEETTDMYEAVGQAVDKLEKQARRSKNKAIDRRRRPDRATTNGQRWPVEVLARESLGAESGPRIIEVEHLPIKPMTIEEAALWLEDGGGELVVFRDATSDRLSVLYKRKDQNYGLIAPEL